MPSYPGCPGKRPLNGCISTSMKYLGNHWMDLRQIHMVDVFGPSLRRDWRSRSMVNVIRDKKWHFSALLMVCMQFVFGKTSLAFSFHRIVTCWFLWQNIMKLTLCSVSGCVFRCIPDVTSSDSVSIFVRYLLFIIVTKCRFGPRFDTIYQIMIIASDAGYAFV